MAASRLIALLIVMLFVSSLAALLVPAPERDGDATTTSTTTPTTVEPAGPGEAAAGGELVEASVEAGRDRPQVVRVRAGDQLALAVFADPPGEVAIPALGRLDFAAPGAPARFDLLLDSPGSYAVERLESGEPLARIVVRD